MKNSSSVPIVRPACMGEADAIHRVIVSAFQIDEDTPRWASMKSVSQGWSDFLVMERAGQLVGVVRVRCDRVRLGVTEVLKGEIGYVSIRHDQQGQGLGTLLMQETMRYMDKHGFHISRLGGLNEFYSRFGYVPFPRRLHEFPIEPITAGVKSMEAEQVLATCSDDERFLRPFEAKRDWRERCRLFDLFNDSRTGSLVEARSHAAPSEDVDPSRIRWVYDAGNKLLAYAFATMNGTQLEVYDAAGDPAHLPALACVLKRVLCEGVRRGATEATGRLPFDTRLEAALTQVGVPHVLREMQTAVGSNMLALLSLQRFVTAAASEWSRRLQRLSLPKKEFSLELRVAHQQVALTVSPYGIETSTEPVSSCSCLVLHPRSFLLGALGYRDWHELPEAYGSDLSPEMHQVLAAILRREPIASGPLG